MSTKHSREAVMPMPPGAEDFKLIRGIGPGVTGRLHSAGILTFTQLAALSPNEIAQLLSDLAGLSIERIAKQDWVGQARELAVELSSIESQHNVTDGPSHQHYATFTVELLLDQSNEVRRSRVVHIQQGIEETWGGWDHGRLIDFFVQHAALRPAQDKHVRPIEEVEAASQADLVTASHTHAQAESEQLIDPAGISRQQDLLDGIADMPEEAMAQPEIDAANKDTIKDSNRPGFIGGALYMSELAAISSEPMLPPSFLRSDKPFNVRLTLDLTDVAAPSAQALAYQASIYAKSMAGSRQIVGETYGTLMKADRVAIDVATTGLQNGTYRLEAVVSLEQPAHIAGNRPGLRAMRESSLIQVC